VSEPSAPWRQLIVDVAPDASEAVQGVALEQGALGIEIEDDETRAVPGRALAPTGRVTVIATFPAAPGLEARVVGALGPVVEHFPDAAPEIAWADLHHEDWNAAFKESWTSLQLSERSWVVPSWERESFTLPDDEAVALYLDPGAAFGTGTHETTRLCAQAIDDACRGDAPPKLLLDVGTGSGVLALLALELGVERARGTDIDPSAVRAARENAADNGLADRVELSAAAPDAWGDVHDVVVANVLAEPLLQLAPAIARAVKPGGVVWLSGLLVSQRETIAARYREVGLEVTGEGTDGEWLRLDLKRAR
jgi:ribosomal protein L11 methyltransferase